MLGTSLVHWVDWRGPSSRCIKKKTVCSAGCFWSLKTTGNYESYLIHVGPMDHVFFPIAHLLSLGQERLCVVLSNRGLHHLRCKENGQLLVGHLTWITWITWIIFGERPKFPLVPWSSMNDSWWSSMMNKWWTSYNWRPPLPHKNFEEFANDSPPFQRFPVGMLSCSPMKALLGLVISW